MKIVKNIVVLLLISIAACKSQTDDKSKDNSLIFDRYYEDLNNKEKTKLAIKRKENDTIKIFNKNGTLKQKGLLQDTIQIGWWKYFNSAGKLIEKKEFVYRNNENYINQKIVYKDNKEIDTTKSLFFTIHLADTLSVGKNLGSINLKTYNKYYDSRYTYIIVENEYEDGVIKNDTFGSRNQEIVQFGVYANPGVNTVKGVIYEEILLNERKIDSQNVSLDHVKIKKVFTKTYYGRE